MQESEQDPQIREFADRATQLLFESPANLRDLLRMIASDIVDCLDFERAEQVKQTFVGEDLSKKTLDVLYRVPFADASGDVWIYVLLEHQSSAERLMGLRLLFYMVSVWEAQRRQWEDARVPSEEQWLWPIIPVIFYTGSQRWKGAVAVDNCMHLPAALADYVPRHKTLFLKLKETPAELLHGTGVACALRAFQAEDASRPDLERVLTGVMEELDTLPEEDHAQWYQAVRFVFQLIRHRRPAQEMGPLSRVVAESVRKHRREVADMFLTQAQIDFERGREEGLREAQEAAREAAREAAWEAARDTAERDRLAQASVLLKILGERFPPLPSGVADLVNSQTSEQLLELIHRAATARSFDEIGLDI